MQERFCIIFSIKNVALEQYQCLFVCKVGILDYQIFGGKFFDYRI